MIEKMHSSLSDRSDCRSALTYRTVSHAPPHRTTGGERLDLIPREAMRPAIVAQQLKIHVDATLVRETAAERKPETQL